MESAKISFEEVTLGEPTGVSPEGEAGIGPEGVPTPTPPGPEFNKAIAELFAGLGSAFVGPRPRTPEEFHRRYVEVVTPILDYVGFHEAIGAGGTNLPRWARIGIGVGALVICFIAYHPSLGEKLKRGKLRKERQRPRKAPGARLEEGEREEKETELVEETEAGGPIPSSASPSPTGFRPPSPPAPPPPTSYVKETLEEIPPTLTAEEEEEEEEEEKEDEA